MNANEQLVTKTAPPDLIPVDVGKGCLLLLTAPEYLAGIRRGKWWRRRVALLQRAQYGASGDDLLHEAIPLPAPPRSGRDAYQDASPGGNPGPSVTDHGPATEAGVGDDAEGEAVRVPQGHPARAS